MATAKEPEYETTKYTKYTKICRVRLTPPFMGYTYTMVSLVNLRKLIFSGVSGTGVDILNRIALAMMAGWLFSYGAIGDAWFPPGLGAGPRTGNIYLVEADCATPEEAHRLAEAGYDVDSVRPGFATLYATAEELANLRSAGVDAAILSEPSKAPLAVAGYHTYATLTSALNDFADAYPSICRLESLGESVQGRELWALRITDNPNMDECEPEFKYIGSMHGNEPPGMEMCLRFIAYLLENYGTIERATSLVDATDIWVVPLMNPDGLNANSRYNGNGYDLNRSFPEWPSEFDGALAEGAAVDVSCREPEVAAIMQWTAAHRFVLSANFHTGSIVVNYPYDDDGMGSVYSPSPDEALFAAISLQYSMYNAPMYASAFFTHGITNGAEWYSISGGMQDWNYRYAGCNEVTIEISNSFAPTYSTLDAMWENNRESMLSYLETVFWGVSGVVADAYTGEPVSARITIEGNTQAVSTDPETGDFYRMLLPGTYTATIEAAGYHTMELDATVADTGSAPFLNVALIPEGPPPSLPAPLGLLAGILLLAGAIKHQK